jgi:hypothetical protein
MVRPEEGLDLAGLEWTIGKKVTIPLCHTLPRGDFTRQPVNVACLEALTKVRPVRLPVRRRQKPVRFCEAVVNALAFPVWQHRLFGDRMRRNLSRLKNRA